MASSLNPIATQAPTSNTAATVVLAAPTNGRWILGGVNWSYTAAPTGGSLTISWVEGVTTYTETYAITAAGPGSFSWPEPKRFPIGSTLTVTLAAGGSTTGTVYPHAWTGH